jgi:hypothetical protein
MNWLSFLIGFVACVVLLALAIFGGIIIAEWRAVHEARTRHSAPLRKALTLLRDVRGTLRTDQYDGHVRIAVKIDDFLRSQP